MSLVKNFKDARKVATPLVAVNTPDPGATVAILASEAIVPKDGVEAAKVQWDSVRALTALNDEGKAAVNGLGCAYPDDILDVLKNAAEKLPENGVLFVHNLHRMYESAQVVQAIWNLRDKFKSKRRTLVILGPGAALPPELVNDVLIFDEALPDAKQLASIVREVSEAAKLNTSDECVARAVEAVQGLAAFPAEQAVAMALTKQGIDIKSLWQRKRQMIEQTPGLKVYDGNERFDSIGGVSVVKGFLSKIIHGKARPNAVVFVDEIEKVMAGASGDTSGVSQDQLGTLLSYMEDHRAVGAIFVGPPGSSKSVTAKATGNEAGIPTIQLDLGAAKGSLVGQSEQQLRSALKVVSAVSNGQSLWIATCNNLSSLPPELLRRFTLGVYFFDLPEAVERKEIWNIWLKNYELEAQAFPNDNDWTGAEIKQCCDLAWRLNCTLVEASAFVVPVARSASDQIARLRNLASGRFLSASRPGVYQQATQNDVVAALGRKVNLSE
jgi:hypothetical protein